MSRDISPLRDIAGAFVLAKLLAPIAGAIYGARGAPAGAPELLAQGVALLAFAGSLRLRGLPVPAPWPANRAAPLSPAAWLLLAVPLGLLLRWGSEGTYLLAVWIADTQSATGQIQALASPSSTLPTLLEGFAFGIGALNEEFTYRAMLMGWLAMRFGWPAALVASSAVFGLLHANPVAFIGGIGLGLAYLLSRSLAVAALAHLAANLAHPLLGWAGVRLAPAQGWWFAGLLAGTFLAFLAWAAWRLRGAHAQASVRSQARSA